MGLSGLCAVHCLASAVLVALASTAGGMLLNPLFHEVGLTIAIVLGAVALGRGIFDHGYMAPAVTGSFGLGIMAGAMQLAARQWRRDVVDADRRRDPGARPRPQPARGQLSALVTGRRSA